MTKRSVSLLIVATLGFGFTAAGCVRVAPADSAVAGQDSWTSLGNRQVAFAADHDSIIVTAANGRFRALRLQVSGSPMEMGRIVMTFGNGQTFSPNVRHTFREGSWTRRIDLPGSKRVIRKIEFWYRSVGPASGRATIEVFGQP